MKLKDLPPPKENGTRVKLKLKKEPSFTRIGTLFSPYLWKKREYHVPFSQDKKIGSEIRAYKIRDIESCEVIE